MKPHHHHHHHQQQEQHEKKNKKRNNEIQEQIKIRKAIINNKQVQEK